VLLVNAHLYGCSAFQAPLLHFRRLDGGVLLDTYLSCFERVWARTTPYAP
jgi:hypothetical protein